MIIYWLYPAWEDLDPYYKNTDTGVTFPDDPENSLYINMNLQVSTGDAVIEGAPPPPAQDESVILAEREAEKAAPGSLLAALEVLGIGKRYTMPPWPQASEPEMESARRILKEVEQALATV